MAKPIDEFNTYGITNPDGVQEGFTDFEDYSFDDEKSQKINEFSKDSIKETNPIEEYPQERKSHTNENKRRMDDSRSNSSSSVQSASSAAQAASSVASIGSSLGALAGVVASAVVTAVIVVAVFISTMTMNLSLVMAHTDSLTVQLDISGAQEEDFNDAIVATLEGKDGEYQEQIVNKDTLYLTFNNLLPGKEYFIKVKNKDKVFVEKSFFTSQNEVDKGQILTHYDNNFVVVSAANVVLKANEFYTITAKDAQGNVVFTQDSTNPNEEFVFSVDNQIKLYFSLSVGGSTYSISELVPSDYPEPTPGPEPEPTPGPVVDPVYDYSQGAWSWAADYSSATISFTEIHGLDPLVVQAEVSSDKTKYEDCENDGEISYYASLIESYGTYGDTQRVAIPALGHDYEAEFDWHYNADPDQVTCTGALVCSRNALHVVYPETTVTYIITPPAECGEHATITYTARFTYEGVEYKATKDENGDIVNHEPESASAVTFPNVTASDINTETGEYIGNATASFTCTHCHELVEVECDVETSFTGAGLQVHFSYGDASSDSYVSYSTKLGDSTISYAYDTMGDSMIVESVPDVSVSKVEEVVIPTTVYGKTVKGIISGAFNNKSYTSITVPACIESIGSSAFAGCTNLTNLTLEKDNYKRSSLKTIGSYAFKDCSSLTSLDLPAGGSQYGTVRYTGIITMGEGVFDGCTSLESLTVPVAKAEWFGRLFGENAISLEKVTAFVDPFTNTTYYIPKSLKTLTLDQGSENYSTGVIGTKEFYGITTIETVIMGARKDADPTSVISNGIRTIGESAFEGCTGLKSVDFNGIRNIESKAFKGCTALTSVSLDSGVQSIGQGFLEGCKSLVSINVPFIGDTYSNATPQGTNPEKTSENFVLGYFFGTTSGSGLTAVQQKSSSTATAKTYYIPSGLTEIYVGTKNTSYNTKAGIYYGAFMNCSMVQTVHLGPYITAITSDAFAGSGVTKIYFMATDTYQVYDSNGNSKGSYNPEALEDASTNATTMKANTGYLWRIY